MRCIAVNAGKKKYSLARSKDEAVEDDSAKNPDDRTGGQLKLHAGSENVRPILCLIRIGYQIR